MARWGPVDSAMDVRFVASASVRLAHHRDEELRIADGTGHGVDDGQGLTRPDQTYERPAPRRFPRASRLHAAAHHSRRTPGEPRRADGSSPSSLSLIAGALRRWSLRASSSQCDAASRCRPCSAAACSAACVISPYHIEETGEGKAWCRQWETASRDLLERLLTAGRRDPGRFFLVAVQCRRQSWLRKRLRAMHQEIELVGYRHLHAGVKGIT